MTEGSDLKKEVLPPTDGSMEKKSKESKKIMRSRKIKESEEGQENKGTKETKESQKMGNYQHYTKILEVRQWVQKIWKFQTLHSFYIEKCLEIQEY